jgi:hypothetical protein
LGGPEKIARWAESPETDGADAEAGRQAVKESAIGGEPAGITTSSAVFREVGQAVSPADFLSRQFAYSFACPKCAKESYYEIAKALLGCHVLRVGAQLALSVSSNAGAGL